MAREIDDATAQAYENLRKLHDALYTDPELGLSFKEMIKKKFPKVSIPEIDAAAPAMKRIDGIEKAVNEIRDLFKTAKSSWDADKQAEQVKSEFSFTDEGMDRVRKRSEEDKIPLRAAAALLVHETPEPVQPSGISGGRWDLFAPSGEKDADADLQVLMKDPERWMESVIEKTWNPGRKPLPVGV